MIRAIDIRIMEQAEAGADNTRPALTTTLLLGTGRIMATADSTATKTLRKAYRFRLRPTRAQEEAMLRQAGARRFVWNWALARRKEHYEATGKTLGWRTLSGELTVLKRQPGMEWLSEVQAQALHQAIRDLDRAFAAFFERVRLHKRGLHRGPLGFPKFRSRKRDLPRFRMPQNIRVADGRVYCPKIGMVRIRQSRPIDGTIKGATFSRDSLGHWYVTIVAEFDVPDAALPPPDPAKVVGIDAGLIDFVTLSDGSAPVPAPKFYRKGERAIRKAHRVLSRRAKGSNRHAKARLRVAKVHRRVAHQRGDFLHKLTTDLIRSHDGLCIEDLNLVGLARNKRLGKSFRDAAFGEFRRQLEYKAEWNRRHLVAIDRFYPSSRLCNVCGAVNDRLTLSDREWDCDCGTHHRRDYLAACNVRDEGLRIIAEGYSEMSNARGVGVRPSTEGIR